ncbi:uncharacterized protein LOC130083499 isoform X1 [Rhinichthys klamathensis goyatoka]|uniref:uncharacterized protein LOC130083499 isoform X1 n=1 Tax=Rhinichthys klamathensis goyatoka TaxID=3034132 RepID=UPI0024B4AD07|nr:uncharacterized protein LOC130083499 isoform X1 [Rhinichthys klamathensis goyatoka]
MELFIFIAFQLLMEVQTYKSPAVKVSPDVLRESRSVKMICETPADVTVKQCYFYRNSEQENNKVSPSCKLELTGVEVLRWADVKSPASVDIYCFYIITENGTEKTSPHSPAATVTVLVSTTASTAHPTTTAMTTSLTVRSTSETTTYSKTVFLATSTLRGNRNMSEHEVSSVHTPTADPKDPHTPQYTGTWFIVLVSTGVAVILTGFICLCRFASKERRKQ